MRRPANRPADRLEVSGCASDPPCALASTTLIDNFAWIAEPGTTAGTEPVPDPK